MAPSIAALAAACQALSSGLAGVTGALDRDLDIAPADVALYQELAGALIYPHEALRAPEAERAAVTLGSSMFGLQGPTMSAVLGT